MISALLACMGLWVSMFGAGKARISKSTGADKRTSGFPFANSESASGKKREKEGKEGKRKSLSSKFR